MKKLLKRWLTDTSSHEYFIVSDVLALVTVVSIVSIVLETVPSLADYGNIFSVIEWAAVFVFSLEYIGRIIITKPTIKYIFSFYGLIDLISIAPTFLGLGNFTFLKSARAIRLIRLLRMVRLAKMKRLKSHEPDEKMSFFAINISLFLLVMLSSVLAVGILIYLVEGSNPAFKSVPHGMLWSFKMFLLGLPITYPGTVGGQVVHILGRLVGLVVFGVLVGVSGNVIKDYLFKSNNK